MEYTQPILGTALFCPSMTRDDWGIHRVNGEARATETWVPGGRLIHGHPGTHVSVAGVSPQRAANQLGRMSQYSLHSSGIA